MTNVRWFQLHVNPEPWVVGPLSVGRRGGRMVPMIGRSQQMEAYQSAVREELEDQGPELLNRHYILDFFFWRRLDVDAFGNRRQHQADGTNMMKATEDALQGVVIGNDRDVLRAQWTIVAQGPDVAPGVLIRVEWGLDPNEVLAHLPRHLYNEVMGRQPLTVVPKEDDNAWPPAQ